MRALVIAVAFSVGCGSASEDPQTGAPDTGKRKRDAAWWEEDSAAVEDTFVEDVGGSGVDATTADSTVVDTETDVPMDLGPPGLTWSTDFPRTGDTAPAWVVDRAVLATGETVLGSRSLPKTPPWASWRATFKFQSDQLTCASAVVRFSLRWNCKGTTTCASTFVDVNVAKATAASTTTVSGPLLPVPVPDPGQPGPLAYLTIRHLGGAGGVECGRLEVAPGTVTFIE